MKAMAQVTLLYFAQAQERCGCRLEIIEISAVCSTSAVRALLAQRHPTLTTLLPHCRLALDQSFIEGPLTLMDGSELAVIPPVSGG